MAEQMESQATSPPPPVPVAAKPKLAVMTLLACAACVVVFVGLGLEQNSDSWDTLSKWGYHPSDRIRDGALWAFVTSVFVHLAIWHVAFNVYWLYILGSQLERAIGRWRWLAFFFASAFVSSGAEFAITDGTGIGASGVVYAIFGFMWLTRKQFPSFESVLNPNTISLFLIWLVACIIMTVANIWTVGNSAHIAGLLFGTGVGAWLLYKPHRRLVACGIGVLVLFSVVPIFYAPWSPGWTALRGNRAFAKGDYQAAIRLYERSLSLGEDKTWCWQNMALTYHAMNDQDHYQKALQTLHGLDEKAAREIETQVAQEKK
jgi:membrane associated rhomboid family serine protease